MEENQLLMMIENYNTHLEHSKPKDVVFDIKRHKQLGFKFISMSCLICGNNTGYPME